MTVTLAVVRLSGVGAMVAVITIGSSSCGA
jgi:hypothetical protein